MYQAIVFLPLLGAIIAGVIALVGASSRHPGANPPPGAEDHAAPLVPKPKVGIPSAAMEVFELRAEDTKLFGVDAGGRRESDRDGTREVLDDEDVAELLVAHHMRRAVIVLGVDPVHVGAGRLCDVGIC